jgi:hypothetical protein
LSGLETELHYSFFKLQQNLLAVRKEKAAVPSLIRSNPLNPFISGSVSHPFKSAESLYL